MAANDVDVRAGWLRGLANCAAAPVEVSQAPAQLARSGLPGG